MRPLIRISAVLAAASLLILPARVVAHSGTAKMPMIAVKILSPAPGAVIGSNAVSVRSAFASWKLNCALAGKANVHGVGHYHIFLDGGLVNMYCGDTASVSLQNSAVGLHSLMVVPADNNHSDMMYMKEAKTVKFTYHPTQPLTPIKPATLGKPSISITSPANGQTVSGTFPVTVSVHNFRLSCALYGKQNLKGYGHWHLNHDSMMGPMMGMGTMLGMSCAHSFQASTAGLKPGPHTFYAILEDNQHAPIMPDVSAKVSVNVK